MDPVLLRESKRRPEIAYSWFPLPAAAAPTFGAPSRCTVDVLARSIHASLGLRCESHRDLLLRVDGYALAHELDIAVVRDGDVVHVSAPDSLHGGPWPESPGVAALPTNFFATTTTPTTAPPALAPRREAMETAPERERDGEGKDRSRSARRKALKRARARAEKYGSAGGGGSGREIPPPPAAPPTKRSRLARGDHPDRSRVIRPAPAGADSLDPNGDLAANGGSLATWDERGWVPRPDDAALAAAQAAAQKGADATRKKIAFGDHRRGEDDDRPSRSSDSSSSSDASSSDSSDSDSSSGDDEDERTAAGGGTAGDDDDVLRDEWLALATAGDDDASCAAGGDCDGRVERGDVVAYTLHDRALVGVVESTQPDFGGDGGGVRVSARLTPHPESRRLRGLAFAAKLIARGFGVGGRDRPAPPFDGIEPDGTVTVGVDELVRTARLVGGPRFEGATNASRSGGDEGKKRTPAIEADLEDASAEGSDPEEVQEETRWLDAARPKEDPPPMEGRGWTWEDLINDHAYDPYQTLGYDPNGAAPAHEKDKAMERDDDVPRKVPAPGAAPTGAALSHRWRQSGAAAAAAAAAAGGGGETADSGGGAHSEPERAPTPDPPPEPRVAAAPPPKSPKGGKARGRPKGCPERRALEVVFKRSMDEWRKSLPKGKRDKLDKDLKVKPGAPAKDFHLIGSIHKIHWDDDKSQKRAEVVAELNKLWESFQIYHRKE